MTTVGIAVAVYNGEKYLRETLSSIESQNYGKIEVIIGDDCSTDGSKLIISEYIKTSALKVELISNLSNLGPIGNLDKIIRSFSDECEVILILPQDDVIGSNHVHNIVKSFKRKNSLLNYRALYLDEFGTPNGSDVAPIFFSKFQSINMALMLSANYIVAPGCAIRRSSYLNFSENERADLSGDWALFAHLLLGGRIKTSVRNTIGYRRHNTNLSRDHGFDASHRESWNWRIEFISSENFYYFFSKFSRIEKRIFLGLMEKQMHSLIQCHHTEEYLDRLSLLQNSNGRNLQNYDPKKRCELDRDSEGNFAPKVVRNENCGSTLQSKSNQMSNLLRICYATLAVYRRMIINLIKY